MILTRQIKLKIIPLFLFAILALTTIAFGQRDGDILAFQGFTEPNQLSVKALGLGGAYTAHSGDLNSLFYNPAGLIGIKKFQLNISGSYNKTLWRDNQVWYAGSDYKLINIYLEHLYTPPSEFNGIFSDSLGNPLGLSWNPDDFRDPVIGKDPYSKDAADNENSLDNLGINNVALAMPFLGSKLVGAVAYQRRFNIQDYDWNGSHLDPNWGNSELLNYAVAPDSILRSYWSVYTRKRTGNIHSVQAAVAYNLSDAIQLGGGFNTMFGETKDGLSLDRIGYFDFIHADADGRWAFSYDTLLNKTEGTSKYSGSQLNLGALLSLETFDVGFQVKLPYTIERKWDYTNTISTNEGISSSTLSGTDKVKMPATYTLGLAFRPNDQWTLSFDLERTSYSKADFQMASVEADTSKDLPSWADQKILRFGVEYDFNDNLALLAGYRNWGTAFVPYGNAIRDEGPNQSSYSLGFSWKVLFGRLDAVYELHQLKYYDVYFNNRNYAMVRQNNVYIGYTIGL